MEVGIVSRETELASIRAFVGGASQRLGALVIEGEAGIGKSTLWRAGVAYARGRGLRVLVSQPAEAELHLAHVGLGDLFEGLLDDVLPELSPPRRRALELALLMEEVAGERVDHHALALAVRGVLQLLSEEGGVLIAVDDVQWLDSSSSAALSFALRRLPSEHVTLLLARRLVEGAPPVELVRALDAERVQRVAVGPLSVGGLHRFLHERLGRAFARQTLLRIHERSGGNPFFALELAQALAGEIDLLEPLHVPETLEDLVDARISALPVSTREALALASALGTVSESLLERAGVAAEALEPAFAAHVIERERGVIRFTHPLLSSVLYQNLGEERRMVHGRIAGIVDDPLLRARHLALATDEPDADVAAALDDAANVATDRGAAAAAAELAEHAVRLTPPGAPETRRRRALQAARAHQAAGEWTRARMLAGELLAESDPGPWRAEALLLLSELESVAHAAEVLKEALEEATSRPELQSLIHCRLAWVMRFRGGFDHAAKALELADQLGDGVLRERAGAVHAILGWFAGRAPAPVDLPQLVPQLPGALGGERLVQEATQAIVNTLAPAAKREEARAILDREYLQWRDQDEPRSARGRWGLAWLEFWAGHWALAAEHAAAAYDVAIQYGLEVPQDHLPIAVIAVHRGELERAREHSTRALLLAEQQLGGLPPQHIGVFGLVALGHGDAAAALERFDEANERAARFGWGEPSLRWWVPDHVELLLEQGRVDGAVDLLDVWHADARRVEREWVLAHVARCRGLVASARGDIAQAVALFDTAVAAHEAVGDPFGRGRALLALGVARRRARRKRSAREAIEEALDVFETIGASAWAAKAQAEVGRLSGRKQTIGLTPAERRVAVLVAEGKTNHEVATALFLGERTVASHLTHIYAKLGVRSRTELARRLDRDSSA
jgi:DNA-binding CsgD family transcriptional regulator